MKRGSTDKITFRTTHFRKLPKPGRFRSTSYKTPRQWLRIILYFLYSFPLYQVTRDQVELSVSLFFCHKQCKHAEIKHLNIVFPATKYTLSHINKTKPKNVCPSTFFCWIRDKKLDLNNKNILDSIVIRSSINSRMLSNVRFTIKVEFWHKNGIHIYM